MTAKAKRPTESPAAKTVRTVGRLNAERGTYAELPSMEEPSLREMLRDPIMQRLMTSDGITRNQLMLLVAAARSRMTKDDRDGI